MFYTTLNTYDSKIYHNRKREALTLDLNQKIDKEKRSMRKITKIKRSIRAISPIISVLLMIAIAVVASLVVYAWVMGYIGYSTTKSGNAIQIQSESYVTGGNLIVYVQNTGQGLVHLSQDGSVYVNNVLCDIINYNNGPTLATGALVPIPVGQTVTIQVNYQNFQPGDKIKIVTVEGTTMETTGTSSSGGSNQYQVTFVLGSGGSSMSPAAGSYSEPGTVAITATAASGYQFSGWTSTGTITFDSSVSASTYANIGSAGSITANFVATSGSSYTVNFILGSGGASMTPAAGSYSESGTVAITATAASGYQFSSWSSTGTISFDSATSASTNAHIGSAGSITANFVATSGSSYTVMFVLGSGGASMTPAAGSYSESGTVAITATAASGYQFSSWTSTGTITFDSSVSASTYANIGSAGSITANFVATSGSSYTVNFILGSGGASMTPAAGSYSESGTVAITATAASGYQFSSWSSTGTISFDSATSASTNAHIGSAGSITANFVATSGSSYTVMFVLGSGGASMTPAAGSYSESGTVAITATAASGYQFSSWTSTGTITFDSSVSASTYANIGSAGSITANFVATSGSSYTVNFILGSGGASMTPAAGSYSESGTVAITATAASGYQFSSWSSTGTISFDSATSASTNAHIGSAGSITANFVAS